MRWHGECQQHRDWLRQRRFGSNDPVSRAQITAILWRYAGSPSAEAGQDFADESSIPAYASAAVDWARANGVVNGTTGNRFDPNGNATRAQVATILRNYLTMTPVTPQPDPGTGNKILVAYFSGSGNTERVAQDIADELDADIFEITPVTPYTSADLDWTVDGSRVNREHDNEALRDIALTQTIPANWDAYDTVFIGYPIWWGIAAWPVNNFVRGNDFSGKTVIPFATSSSSGMGQSGTLLEGMANGGTWQSGQRFSSGASSSTVRDWAAGWDCNIGGNAVNSENQTRSRCRNDCRAAAFDGLRSCGRGSPRVDRYGNVRSVRGTPYTQPKVAVGSRKGQIHAHLHGSDGVGRNHLSFYVRFND